jgi:2-keto-3-deoxy-L-rhamnonate aldolase RhmA
MQPNPILQALRAGQVVIGTMIVQVRAPAIIQLFAEYGLEYFFVDMEHGSYNLETAADLIQVARLAGIVPMVRVGETQYTLYARLLDAGAQGIMTPRVESVEQVRQIIRYTKYPPLGERGFSRLAAHLNYAEVDIQEYVAWANESMVNIIQIESARGVNNLEDMLCVPGVDAVIVGMDDLSLSLGVPGNTRHSLAEQMLERVAGICQAKRVPWGLHIPDAARLVRWIERGMQLATFSSDIWMLQDMLRANVDDLKRAGAKREGQAAGRAAGAG